MNKKKITINTYLIRNKWALFGLVIFSIFSGIGQTLWSFVYQALFELAEALNRSALIKVGFFVAFCFTYSMVMDNVAVYFRRVFLKEINLQLKADVFHAIINKDINEFTESNSAKYISILNNDVTNLENQYFLSIPTIIDRACIFIGCMIALVYHNIMIAIVVLLTAMFLVLLPFLFGNKISESEKAVYDELEGYNGRLKDLLGGFEVIKSFNAVERAKGIFNKSVNRVENARYTARRYQNPYAVFLLSMTYLVIVLQLLFATYMAFIGKIPVSAIMGISYLISSINNPLKDIANEMIALKAARPNAEKVEALLNETKMEKTENLVTEMETVMPLEVKNLSFAYEEGKEILHGLNFWFEENKKYAIVGNSGSGKSTLVKLLMKYYDIYEGNIYWGDCELRKLDKEFLCTQVAMIHQKVFLFEDTLRNNITMFQEYPEEEIQYAVEASGLREVVERHPEGLDFVIHENGNNFSGGEQQRISIARAILKKAKVLLLDEATSSLDKKMSSQIERLLLNQSEMTVLTITHKLDAAILKQYDCILAMNHGNIMESGKFDELMEKKGFFYSLYTVNE